MADSVNIPVNVTLQIDQHQLNSVISSITSTINKAKNFNTKNFFSPITNSAKTLTKGLKGVQSGVTSLSNSFSVLKRLALSALSLTALIKLGKEMIQLSSNLVEVQDVVDTVFGNMSDDVNDFANSVLKSFGLTELQAKNYASTIGSIVKATGAGAEATLEMSEGITKLAGDIASFYNLDHDTAFEKLRSGITGETEPLKSLGVVVTETNLEAYRMAQGIATSYGEMNQAEKTALRYNYILDTLSDAQGDFNKTQGSWSNQVRILTGQIKQLGAILGGFLQNVLYPLLTVINQIISMAISGASALSKMFGFDLESIQESQGVAVGVSIDESGSSAMDDLADSTYDAVEAQEELNKAQNKGLANIHDLNVLQSKDTSTYDTSEILSGFDFELSKYKDISETDNPINSLFKNLENAVNNNDWRGVGYLLASELNDVMAKVDLSQYMPNVENSAFALADIINGFVQNINFDNIGKILGDGFNLIMTSFNTLFDQLDFISLGSQIAISFNSLFDTVNFDEFGKFLINKFNAIFQIISGFVTEFNWSGLGLKFADAINSIFANFDFSSLSNSISGFIGGLLEAIGSAIANIKWGNIASNISTFLVNFVKALSSLIKNTDWIQLSASLYNGIKSILINIDWAGLIGSIGELIFNAVGAISAILLTITVGIVQDIVNIIWSISGYIADVFRNIISVISEFMGNIIGIVIFKLYSLGSDIAGWLSNLISSIASWLSIAGSNISSWLTDVWGRFTSLLGDIISYITGTFSSAWTNAWGGIRDVFNTLFDNIGGIFSGMINTVIDAINSMIGAINSISWNVPDWVPGIGGSSFGFSIPNIPKLAQGAVIPPNQEFIALLGDQRSGVNIETPLDTMIQAFREALSEFSDYNIGDIVIPIYIDNELSSEEIIRKQDIERYRSNGK